MHIKEKLFEEKPSQENRSVLQQAQEEVKRYLHLEEQFWRQKAAVTWFEKRDRNTRFFHSFVKGRIKKLHMSRIQKY